MPEIRQWLIVNGNTGELRVLSRQPALKPSEVAFPLVVRLADTRQRVFTDKPIILTMPGWTPPEVEVLDPETVQEADMERQNGR